MASGFGEGMKTTGGCLLGIVLMVLFYIVVAAVATFILRGLGLDPSSGWAIVVYIVALFGCFYAVERITKRKF